MKWKLAAAGLAACLSFALPSAAYGFDQLQPREQAHAMFFLEIPLDARTPRESHAAWGFSIRGKRDYQVFKVDSRAVEGFTRMGFIESKIAVVGLVAAAGAMAMVSSGSNAAAAQAQQRQEAEAAQAAAQQQSSQQPSTPKPPAQPCPQRPAC